MDWNWVLTGGWGMGFVAVWAILLPLAITYSLFKFLVDKAKGGGKNR